MSSHDESNRGSRGRRKAYLGRRSARPGRHRPTGSEGEGPGEATLESRERSRGRDSPRETPDNWKRPQQERPEGARAAQGDRDQRDRPSAARDQGVRRSRLTRDEALDVDSGTDFSKHPSADPFKESGPNPWVAAALALSFTGLGQIYNGRWFRGVASIALPAICLGVAAYTLSFTGYLIAFGSGALTAPTALSLIAALFGWLPLGHPAFWMGLPIKVALVGEAALDAYLTRRIRGTWNVRRWTIIAYGVSGALLVLIWMFAIGLATVRQPGMNPVLEPGDHLVIDRSAYGLQLPLIGVRLGGSPIRRGDRVAVLDPEGSGELLIRRVFAVAGDRVAFEPPRAKEPVRQPRLGEGGSDPTPVTWQAWKGPCVYPLAVAKRRKHQAYARCRAYLEIQGKRRYIVSYPRSAEGGGAEPKAGKVPRGKVYLLSDNRGEGRDSRHWGPVSTRRIRGKPRVVLWSSDPLEGIRWHRLGLDVKDRP